MEEAEHFLFLGDGECHLGTSRKFYGVAERVAKHRAREELTLAEAKLEASDKHAAAKIRMAEGVIAEDGEARQIYLNFLRAGDSRYPLEVFRLGGVDMTSPEPVEKAFGVLDDLVSRLEAFTS